MRAFLLVVVYVVQGAVLQMRCVSINESSNGGGNPQVHAVRLPGYAGFSESWLLYRITRTIQEHRCMNFKTAFLRINASS